MASLALSQQMAARAAHTVLMHSNKKQARSSLMCSWNSKPACGARTRIGVEGDVVNQRLRQAVDEVALLVDRLLADLQERLHEVLRLRRLHQEPEVNARTQQFINMVRFSSSTGCALRYVRWWPQPTQLWKQFHPAATGCSQP